MHAKVPVSANEANASTELVDGIELEVVGNPTWFFDIQE
jgi:hypothetical protein